MVYPSCSSVCHHCMWEEDCFNSWSSAVGYYMHILFCIALLAEFPLSLYVLKTESKHSKDVVVVVVL